MRRMVVCWARRGPGTAVAVLLFLSACNKPAQSQVGEPLRLPTPPPLPSNQVGRYQIVPIREGQAGTIVLMLDTVEGTSWVYHQPQGQAINGYWSDIPRLSYRPEVWQSIFAGQQSVPPAATSPPSAPLPPVPPATNVPAMTPAPKSSP